MAVAETTNPDGRDETGVPGGAPLAARLQGIRERLARKLARPVLKAPEIHPPECQLLERVTAQAAHLAPAIGTVNPRPGGVINKLAQMMKRSIARLLGWTYRPQREFNGAMVESLARLSEMLAITNQNIAKLAGEFTQPEIVHGAIWQEIDSLRDAMDYQKADLDRRVAAHNAAHGEEIEEKMKRQRWAYEGALTRQSTALQDRTYELLGNLQDELGKSIANMQEQVRLLRHRVAAQARPEAASAAEDSVNAKDTATSALRELDYFRLEQDFRGAEEEIRSRQRFYLPYFEGRKNVLDIACGRGEFLELMREANVTARGVDLDADMVGRCLEKDLNVVQQDVFAFLGAVPDGSLDGIFCSQFVEHLEAQAYIRLIAQCGQKLSPGGVLAVETQNPECLAIFSQTFFLDPTHVRPVPPALLRVLFDEAGLERLSTHYLSPARTNLPLIPQLSSEVMEPDLLQAWNAAASKFNETFFGGMDYAIIGYRSGVVKAEKPLVN